MARLEKLSISGIRSFGPIHEETIDFAQPLTVILGGNGTGKTTIVECLRMAMTGALPSFGGFKSGQYFIHRPPIEGASVVNAAIRLRCRNRANQAMEVHRAFRCEKMSNGKCRYSALDGSIKTEESHGSVQAMAQKCCELDKRVPEVMGVSAAVLNDVSFCEQEESAWPMEEPKILKKKMDEIFGLSSYTEEVEPSKEGYKENKVMENEFEIHPMEDHSKQLQNINMILCDLWQTAYKRGDIETIEVVSEEDHDEETDEHVKTKSETTKSYNYRVMMKMNDKWFEMRHYCSPGQRMLASLVIRIALAEIFSPDCGILTVDEPTTNLDYDNKVALAEALVELISNRSSQGHLQLILLSHDEGFLRNFTRSPILGENIGAYYTITREQNERNGLHSHIQKLTWRA